MFLVRKTTKWEFIGKEYAEEFFNDHKGVVGCFWHSRIMLAHSIWPHENGKCAVLISLSKDGGFVAKATEILGHGVVRGSSSRQRGDATQDKGALQAFRAMVQNAKKGEMALITPDGPRGPRMRVQQGTIRIAKAAKVPILPLAAAVRGAKYAKSWDRFVIPPLFSRGVIIYGAPIEINTNDENELEILRQNIEAKMIEITQKADEMVGGPLIEPEAAQ